MTARLCAGLRWLFTPRDCPIHDACVRIGLTMGVGLWAMLAIVALA